MTPIIRPHITEKTLRDVSGGWYTFVVRESTDKQGIRDAVQAIYNVTVVDIKTARMWGKSRRVGRKMMATRRPDWKKARVRLADGQKIDAFESVMDSAKNQVDTTKKSETHERIKEIAAPKSDVTAVPTTERRRGDYAK